MHDKDWNVTAFAGSLQQDSSQHPSCLLWSLTEMSVLQVPWKGEEHRTLTSSYRASAPVSTERAIKWGRWDADRRVRSLPWFFLVPTVGALHSTVTFYHILQHSKNWWIHWTKPKRFGFFWSNKPKKLSFYRIFFLHVEARRRSLISPRWSCFFFRCFFGRERRSFHVGVAFLVSPFICASFLSPARPLWSAAILCTKAGLQVTFGGVGVGGLEGWGGLVFAAKWKRPWELTWNKPFFFFFCQYNLIVLNECTIKTSRSIPYAHVSLICEDGVVWSLFIFWMIFVCVNDNSPF